MTKAQMIDAIIGAAKGAAILANKPLDMADLFFDLAFLSESDLAAICRKLKIL